MAEPRIQLPTEAIPPVPGPLTDEQLTKLAAIHEQVHAAQKAMGALRGELELEPDPALKPFISTLARKSAALGHMRDDLVEIPKRVGEERRAIASRGARS